jgi:hypothetical protein
LWPAAVQGGPELPASVAGAPRVRHTRSHLTQKDQETEMVLTELEIEGWTGAAVLAAKSGGGAPAARSALGLSGLLDGTARPKAVLREGYGGQGGSGATGGEKLQWRRCLPAAAILAEGCGGAGGSGVELWARWG